MSDDKRPTRPFYEGGVGAVMGSRVKAIVVDLDQIPEFGIEKGLLRVSKTTERIVQADGITALKDYGTAMMADYTNYVGGCR